ncbi:MAG: hypothetical protein PHE24_04135 [Patescibacteria group bacterium]|nr:hypothetical protein [Patescibacteria group bacterium]
MAHKSKIVLIVVLVIAIAIIAAAIWLIPKPIILPTPSPSSSLIVKNPALPSYCYAEPALVDPWGRDPKYDVNKLPASKMVVKLASVGEKPGVRPDLGLTEQRNFSVYLERPDLGLKQENCLNPAGTIYTSDLIAGLQPKRMVFDYDSPDSPISSARDAGNGCDYLYFPHSCVMNLTATSAPIQVLMKVAFQDGTFAEQMIAIPFAGKLADPSIFEPKAMPKNGDKFALRFKDVGADIYQIRVEVCHPYENNGINPCLKGWVIYLNKEKGKIVLDRTDRDVNGLKISTADGAVVLQSDQPFDIAADDNKVRYTITADKSGQIADGVGTTIESNFSITYP